MEDRDLRDKTLKLGLVARALGIYRVERAIVFWDPKEESHDDASFIVEVLRYLETPQYLRKKIFPLKPRLAYAGLLPPLKIPSHRPRVGISGLKDGEVREALVERREGVLVADVGMDTPISFKGNARAGSRVTVVVRRRDDQLYCEQIQRSQVKEYWGFEVNEQRELGPLLTDGRVGLVVATSRKGVPVTKVWTKFASAMKAPSKKLFVFGAPKRGLYEMYPASFIADRCDFVLNTIPGQGTETVRTEEALLITLALASVAGEL
jgi:hypothetical protein